MYNLKTGRSEYLLPCFMTSGDSAGKVQMIWVAPRVRRMKIGSILEQWHPHSLAQDTVPEARDFWTAIGFTEVVDECGLPMMTTVVDEFGLPMMTSTLANQSRPL